MLVAYEFRDFDMVDGVVAVPVGAVFYRGVPRALPPARVMRDAPMYISSFAGARNYGDMVYALQTTRHMRLVDLRKLKGLLQDIIQTRSNNDPATLDVVKSLVMSFGLCSYAAQVGLIGQYLQQNAASPAFREAQQGLENMMAFARQAESDVPLFVNPVEPQGVRFGETTNDAFTMYVLKELFQDIFDGFIAPRVFSPFFNQTQNHMHEEIVVFQPRRHLAIVDPRAVTASVHISELLAASYTLNQLHYVGQFKARAIYMTAGAEGGRGLLADKNSRVPNARALVKQAKRFAKQVRAPPAVPAAAASVTRGGGKLELVPGSDGSNPWRRAQV